MERSSDSLSSVVAPSIPIGLNCQYVVLQVCLCSIPHFRYLTLQYVLLLNCCSSGLAVIGKLQGG